MAIAKRPLTLDELGEAVSIEPCQSCFMPDRLINDTQSIVRWCHGLVALHDLDDAVQFTHSSVKEFFCSPDTDRVIIQGFHFRQDEADREFGGICATYLNFNDFKTQLVRLPKTGAFLDPMEVASHTLNTRAPSIVLNKARELLRTRSKSSSGTSRLLLPHAPKHADDAVARNYQFLEYASKFWLLHTTDFSPEQGELWALFQSLATERFPVLSEPNILALLHFSNDRLRSSRDVHLSKFDVSTPLHLDDNRVIDLRDHMFPHQHRALFRQCITQHWHINNLPLSLALVLRWKCFSFVRLLPPLARQAELPWLEAVTSLNDQVLAPTLQSAGTEWMIELTLTERSSLLAAILVRAPLPAAIMKLVQLGIDPYLDYDNDRYSTSTLLELLLRHSDMSSFQTVCQAIRASTAGFERKFARSGRTVLHVAAAEGVAEAITMLLEYGALVNATDNHGQTALHLAADEGNEEAMKILLEHGVPVNATDNHGRTALHLAVTRYEYSRRGVRSLLEAGASLDIRDMSGRVAFDCANKRLLRRIRADNADLISNSSKPLSDELERVQS